MSTVLNILWIVLLAGPLFALLWGIFGVLLCLTVIGIPFGIQCFKAAGLMFAPFGKSVDTDFDSFFLANVLWAVLAGWEMFLSIAAVASVLCVTIVGIPAGLQLFKLAKLAIAPFGAKITVS